MKKTVKLQNNIQPQTIIENGKAITKDKELANSINRQFIKQANDTIKTLKTLLLTHLNTIKIKSKHLNSYSFSNK